MVSSLSFLSLRFVARRKVGGLLKMNGISLDSSLRAVGVARQVPSDNAYVRLGLGELNVFVEETSHLKPPLIDLVPLNSLQGGRRVQVLIYCRAAKRYTSASILAISNMDHKGRVQQSRGEFPDEE